MGLEESCRTHLRSFPMPSFPFISGLRRMVVTVLNGEFTGQATESKVQMLNPDRSSFLLSIDEECGFARKLPRYH